MFKFILKSSFTALASILCMCLCVYEEARTNYNEVEKGWGNAKSKKNLFFMLDIDKTLRLANMLANVNM